MNYFSKRIVCALIVLGAASATRTASAEVLDLTSGAGSSGTINGAIFEFGDSQSAGTGVIYPFVRIQASVTEQGYNTSGRPVPFDEKTDPNFTHNLTLGEVGVVTRDGVDYLWFLLDINEPNNEGESLILLNALQFYTSTEGSQTTTDVGSLGTLRYDMDAGGDNGVLLDHSAAEGSGKYDMTALIPRSLFEGALDSDFLYVYSMFGDSGDDSEAGFEEWSTIQSEATPTTIPLPSAATTGVALLVLLAWFRRCRFV